MQYSHKLIRNILYNFGGQALLLLIQFFTTPYIIHKLGDNLFGIFAIVNTVIGYFGFLNLGLGTATVKYIAEYYAKRDFEMMRKIIGGAFAVFTIMGVLGAVIISSVTVLLVSKVLKIPTDLYGVAVFAFYVSAIGFVVNMPLNIFSSIPRAMQRFDIVNKVNVFVGTLQSVLTVTLLVFRYSLKEIVVMNVMISILSILIYIRVSKKLVPELSLKPNFSLSTFSKLLKFGGFVSISRFTSIIAVYLDRFVIGMFMPIARLTYYVIPQNLSQKLGMIPGNIVPVVLPAVSELSSIGEMQKLQELFIRSTKYVAIAVIPLSFILIVYSSELLTFWLGPTFAKMSTTVLQILMVSFLISTLGWTSVIVAQGVDRPDIPAVIQTICAVTNMLLCFLLVPRMGLNGAALSFCINQIIGVSLVIYLVTKKNVGVTIGFVMRNVFMKPFGIGIMIAFACLLIRSFITSLAFLIVVIILASAVYLILSYFFIFDDRDKKVISSYFRTQKGLARGQ